MTQSVFIGIDVSKARLDVALGEKGELFSLSHSELQIPALVRKLKASFPQLIIIEATLPGVGPVTTVALVAYCPEFGTLNRYQIAALVGTAAFNRDSFTKRGQRVVWGGRNLPPPTPTGHPGHVLRWLN
jgi:hypothetical protein